MNINYEKKVGRKIDMLTQLIKISSETLENLLKDQEKIKKAHTQFFKKIENSINKLNDAADQYIIWFNTFLKEIEEKNKEIANKIQNIFTSIGKIKIDPKQVDSIVKMYDDAAKKIDEYTKKLEKYL